MNNDKKYYGIPSNEKKEKVSHENHKLVATPSAGKHYGKLLCMTCGGTFVRWLNKESYYMYK
jgi:hypothetical protein